MKNIQNVKKELETVNNELNEILKEMDYYDAGRKLIIEIQNKNIQTILKITEYELKGVLE